MKNAIVSLMIILGISACKSPAERQQDTCKKMFTTMCQKNEECTGQPVADCLAVVEQETLCERAVTASVVHMRNCDSELPTASCDSLPESCMFLE
jgi:hypothetical protein